MTRIEIEPPDRPGGDAASESRVVIKDVETVRRVVSTLQLLEVSGREAIAECKVPPGFTVHFYTPEGQVTADVTLSGHRHFMVTGGSVGEPAHYELPAAFERVIRPYLMQSVGGQSGGGDDAR